MTTVQDPKGELRAAFTQREIQNARNSISKGVPGLIVRAALVTLFMNLLVIAYLMMGTPGLVFVSLLFLLALLTPLFAQMARKLWSTRQKGTEQVSPQMKPEVQGEV